MRERKTFKRRRGNGSGCTIVKTNDALSPEQETFKNAYLMNGFNATGAYMEAHPTIGAESASTLGYHTLRNVKVRKAIDDTLTKTFAKMEIQNELIIAAYINQAYYDERSFFDEEGIFIGMQNLNIIQQACIKSVDKTNIYKDIEHTNTDGTKYVTNDLVATKVKVEFYSRKSALDSLAKYKGLITTNNNYNFFNDNRKFELTVASERLKEKLGADAIIKLTKQLNTAGKG
jgi:hypothetical protein